MATSDQLHGPDKKPAESPQSQQTGTGQEHQEKTVGMIGEILLKGVPVGTGRTRPPAERPRAVALKAGLNILIPTPVMGLACQAAPRYLPDGYAIIEVVQIPEARLPGYQ